ncbi:hypothetical protein EW146_g6555 [Bondarzewia mesenterica]|uniref:DUF6535 domain-containing protein n=1 Tax=Bondarzewia mesenterica TaxID=1095465 RepID=A0A4V3XEJ1_9AGAM|nr:hypothetical protein EW146_g6555 [Bondarzewia mesenterica]
MRLPGIHPNHHVRDLEKGSSDPFCDPSHVSEKITQSSDTTAWSSPDSEKDHPASGKENEEPDKLKDYDARPSPLWSVYMKEAESHDKALIETWKDDMEGVIIFAGLYSASLTAFLVDSYKQLQPDPPTQSVFLMQQTVILLAQISQQLGPN